MIPLSIEELSSLVREAEAQRARNTGFDARTGGAHAALGLAPMRTPVEAAERRGLLPLGLRLAARKQTP